jgi:hypothetical protein
VKLPIAAYGAKRISSENISAREQSWMLVAAHIDVRGAATINLAQALVLVFALERSASGRKG